MKRICLIVFLLWNATAFSQDSFLETFNLQNRGQALFMRQTEDRGFFLVGNDLVLLFFFCCGIRRVFLRVHFWNHFTQLELPKICLERKPLIPDTYYMASIILPGTIYLQKQIQME